MRVTTRFFSEKPLRMRPSLLPRSDLMPDKTTEVDLQVEELMNLAVKNPIPPHKPRWSACVKKLWSLRGMIKPDVAATISEQYVRHTDHLFASGGKALCFVQFSQQEGLYGGASMDTLADQCFYAALALQPVPDMVATCAEPEAWNSTRKMRVAFALGCQADALPEAAPMARRLAEDCLRDLRDRKGRVTPEDSYVAAVSRLWNCDAHDLLWRRFQKEDFFEWSLPYLVILERSGIQTPDLRHLLQDRLAISHIKDAGVSPRELLDSIRVVLATRHPDSNVEPYFRALANNTDILKKCERSAAAWLMEKVRDTPMDSELLQYFRREDWLNRPHRSNISWMRNRKFVRPPP